MPKLPYAPGVPIYVTRTSTLLPIVPSMADNVGGLAHAYSMQGPEAGVRVAQTGHGQLRQAQPTSLPPQPDHPAVTSLGLSPDLGTEGAYVHKACSSLSV
jgi:hypothetical protein